MNPAVKRFGKAVQRETYELIAACEAGDCPVVETWLALYGALALVKGTIEWMHDESRELVVFEWGESV